MSLKGPGSYYELLTLHQEEPMATKHQPLVHPEQFPEKTVAFKTNEHVRNPYNYDADQLSANTALVCKDPSLADQSFLQESDINYIAERFMRTGEVPQVLNMPTSGDFQGIFDFQEAMNLIKQAKDEFMTLPAKIRSRFDNDPAKLISFLEDPGNRQEAEALGMLAKPPAEPQNQPSPAPEAATPGGAPSAQPATSKTTPNP